MIIRESIFPPENIRVLESGRNIGNPALGSEGMLLTLPQEVEECYYHCPGKW